MKSIIVFVGLCIGAFLIKIGWFSYDPNPNIILQNLSSNSTALIPAGYYIGDIIFENTNGNAVTGGIKIGTTSGGTDVVFSQTVGANSLANLGSTLTKKIFSTGSSQTLFVQAVTSWNSASVNVYFMLFKLK